ncbi:MAG: hypothetical protein ABIH49_01510 [archaeon]
MKSFDEFLKKGVIRKQSQEIPRARNLVFEAERRKRNLNELIRKIGLKEDNSNEIIEDCYSILMCLIRAKMSFEGYKSFGYSAHEAEVSFMQKIGFIEKDIEFTDQLRRFRNQINYEGKKFDKEYARKVIEFIKKNYLKLKNPLNNIL